MSLTEEITRESSSPEEWFLLNKVLPILGENNRALREKASHIIKSFLREGRCPEAHHLTLLNILTSQDYLFYKDQEMVPEYAAKRSLSCVAIGDLLIANIKGLDYFEAHLLEALGEQLIQFMVSGLGEAPGQVPVGDTLSLVLLHPRTSKALAKKILTRILRYCYERKDVFCYGEETRFAYAFSVGYSKLGKEELKRVLGQYSIKNTIEKEDFYPQNMRLLFLSLHAFLSEKSCKDLTDYLFKEITYH